MASKVEAAQAKTKVGRGRGATRTIGARRKQGSVDPAFPIARVMGRVRAAARRLPTPIVTIYARRKVTPFQILVSTIISLRTQDKTTAEASRRVFRLARSPRAMRKIPEQELATAIYPAGFYRTKARTLRGLSETILRDHGGHVPDTVEELVKLRGVGRKTANLVVTLGYGKPGICVDTHVHRICNRWGYVTSSSPDETEMLLRGHLPGRYWIPINDWLVAFGQNICRPASPLCSACPVADGCARRGVGRSR